MIAGRCSDYPVHCEYSRGSLPERGNGQLRKKNTIKAFVMAAGILLPVLLTGCAGSREYKGSITEFSYHYGSYFGGDYEYDLMLQEDHAVHFTARGYNGIELDIDKEVDPSVLEELSSVITDNHLETWEGFSESDDSVLDGYGFFLQVKYNDERTLTASGYASYPENYQEVHDKLVAILESIE